MSRSVVKAPTTPIHALEQIADAMEGLRDGKLFDPDGGHSEADDMLLEAIAWATHRGTEMHTSGKRIVAAWQALEKWYA